MAKARGPAPKPTALKKLTGNAGHRKLNEDEPQPKLAAFRSAPSHLCKYSTECWNALVPELVKLNLLTVVDYPAVEMVCAAYGLWREMRKDLEKHGYVQLVGEYDYRQQNPEVAIMNAAFKNYKDMLGEFGLTPASRARMTSLSGSGKGEEPDYGRFFVVKN